VAPLVAALPLERDRGAWSAMARALGAVGRGDPAARAALIQALADAESHRRGLAFESLQAMVAPADVPALIAARATAARPAHDFLDALILGRAADAGDDPALVTALVTLLGDPDPGCRRGALHALGTMCRHGRAAAVPVRALFGDPDATLGWTAAWAWLRLHAAPPPPGALRPGDADMPAADAPVLRDDRAFAAALATTRSVVVDALASRDLRERARAAELCAYAPADEGVVERLQRIVADARGSGPDHDAARFALRRLAPAPPVPR
jgi:hypothetical protein